MTKRRLFQVVEEWDLFNEYFDESIKIECADDFLPHRGDALILWGGPDVNPTYYHDKPVTYTQSDPFRDILDWTCLTRAVDYGIPIFGVCRGMQIMSPFCGGSLIQDVPGHTGTHLIHLNRQKLNWSGSIILLTNSAHHQMVRPNHGEQEVLGHTIPPTGRDYVTGPCVYPVTQMSYEPEIVSYPVIGGVGVQFHPEYIDAPEESVYLAKHIFKRFILEGKW